MKLPLTIHKGQVIAVIGLGVSGMSGVRYLLRKGAKVLASDNGDGSNLDSSEVLVLKAQGVKFEFGGHTTEFIRSAELALIGPGVPLDSEIVNLMKSSGIPIVGELAVVNSDLNDPVVAVTGTNGKTTVTGLIEEILAVSGKSVFAGGNIGTPIYEYCGEQEKYNSLVLELSSFQLDLAGNFAPQIGLLLNISPDHLDRHGSLGSYIAAKMKLFCNQSNSDYAIINDDDPTCRDQYSKIQESSLLKFGHDHDCDAVITNEKVMLSWQGEYETYSLQNTLLNTVTGRLNSAAAILAARAMGCDAVNIQNGLRTFKPLSHRMEFVKEINGVKYFNDSKATNTGAVVVALKQVDNKAILIAGGRDKGDDYSLLKDVVQEKVKALVLIGEAADIIENALFGVVEIFRANSLAEAVVIANSKAETGDSVLLSPACASFDMFSSYGHRGSAFIKAVSMIKN